MSHQVQELPASSEAPLEYKGCITVDPIMFDHMCLFGALEAGGLELNNTCTNQNLILHHLGSSMTESAIFLQELTGMVGRLYCLAIFEEISWRDLQWVKYHH